MWDKYIKALFIHFVQDESCHSSSINMFEDLYIVILAQDIRIQICFTSEIIYEYDLDVEI